MVRNLGDSIKRKQDPGGQLELGDSGAQSQQQLQLRSELAAMSFREQEAALRPERPVQLVPASTQDSRGCGSEETCVAQSSRSGDGENVPLVSLGPAHGDSGGSSAVDSSSERQTIQFEADESRGGESDERDALRDEFLAALEELEDISAHYSNQFSALLSSAEQKLEQIVAAADGVVDQLDEWLMKELQDGLLESFYQDYFSTTVLSVASTAAGGIPVVGPILGFAVSQFGGIWQTDQTNEDTRHLQAGVATATRVASHARRDIVRDTLMQGTTVAHRLGFLEGAVGTMFGENGSVLLQTRDLRRALDLLDISDWQSDAVLTEVRGELADSTTEVQTYLNQVDRLQQFGGQLDGVLNQVWAKGLETIDLVKGEYIKWLASGGSVRLEGGLWLEGENTLCLRQQAVGVGGLDSLTHGTSRFLHDRSWSDLENMGVTVVMEVIAYRDPSVEARRATVRQESNGNRSGDAACVDAMARMIPWQSGQSRLDRFDRVFGLLWQLIDQSVIGQRSFGELQ